MSTSIGNDKKVRNDEERESDIFRYECYGTPPWATRVALMCEPKLAMARKIIEPGCGPGYMTEEIESFWPEQFKGEHVASDLREIIDNDKGLYLPRKGAPRHVYASDIRTSHIIRGGRGIDFLTTDIYEPESFDAVIFNPPFSLTSQFLNKSMEIVKPGGIVIIIQRMQLIEGVNRYRDIFEPHGFIRKHQFMRRVNFYPEGQVNHVMSGKMNFSLYVFIKGYESQVHSGSFIIEDFKDFGPDALLPQQVGLCGYCACPEQDCCKAALAPKKGNKVGQLTGPMAEWLEDNAPHKLSYSGIGMNIRELCLNWKPIL